MPLRDKRNSSKYIQRAQYVRNMQYDHNLVRHVIEELQNNSDQLLQYIPLFFAAKKDSLADILVAPDKKIKNFEEGIRILALTSGPGSHIVCDKNYTVLAGQVMATIDNITTQQSGAVVTYWFEKSGKQLTLIDSNPEVIL